MKRIWERINKWYWDLDDFSKGMLEIGSAFIVAVAVFLVGCWIIDLIFNLGWF